MSVGVSLLVGKIPEYEYDGCGLWSTRECVVLVVRHDS